MDGFRHNYLVDGHLMWSIIYGYSQGAKSFLHIKYPATESHNVKCPTNEKV